MTELWTTGTHGATDNPGGTYSGDPQSVIEGIKSRSTNLAARAKENFERERAEYARLLRDVEALRKQMEGK